MPGLVVTMVVTVSTVLFETPDPNIMLGGIEAVGPAGSTVVLRLTVPMNPFTLVRVTVDLALAPWSIFRATGLAWIVKSGVTIVNLTTTLWDKLPLVPVTLMIHVLAGAPTAVMNVRVADAVPPDARITLVGLILHEGQTGAGQSGEGEVNRLTVPANPLRLVNVIVEIALDPDCTFCEPGLAAIAKSGVGGGTTVNVAAV